MAGGAQWSYTLAYNAGEVTGQIEFVNDTSVPKWAAWTGLPTIREYRWTYLTNGTYTNAYIRNRVLTEQALVGGVMKTLRTYTYDQYSGANQCYASGFAMGLVDRGGGVAQHDVGGQARVSTEGHASQSPGKLKRVSRPYAPNGTKYWTTYTFDVLGRTTRVEAPANQFTTYEYVGNTVKVTEPKPGSGTLGRLTGAADCERIRLFMLRLIVVLTLACALSASGAWRPVAPVDLSKLKPSQFTDEELDLPFYLTHFHRLANAVVEEGKDRGFIRLSVWRAEKDNQPYNARIMENILSLAWFYSAKRPWNPYYGSPDVRDRLEAALDFWCRIQAESGAFSEYSPGGWNLAATAFATKFMGRTLLLLRDGPTIDNGLFERVAKAQRKAILFVLTDEKFWQHGCSYSNQFTNVWPGALAWLRLKDDQEIRTLMERRISESTTAFQSPAGYFYEAGGPDWSYNFGTHHSNLLGAWHYAKGSPLEKHFIDEERRFFEWVSYNAVPDGDDWQLNRAIETRQQLPAVKFSYRLPLSERVMIARPFVPSSERASADLTRRRRELERNWPATRELRAGEFTAFAPYVFLHRGERQLAPSEAEKAAARRMLPYFAKTRFVHQRMDSRSPAVHTFVRRPAYYAAWNSGKRIREQQRLGLGLVWTEAAGVILQSQSRSEDSAWGTVADGQRLPYEAGDVDAQIGSETPRPGARDIASEGDLTVRYKLGGHGEKTLTFADDEIRVTVDHEGPFVEQIPLLSAAAPSEVRPGSWRIGPHVTLAVDGAQLREQRLEVAGKKLYTLRASTKGKLRYSIQFRQ